MCNIAGYAGKKNAAPILVEMLRRQQIYDGGFSSGVATIYEGKLYYRKVVGDVDALIRETNVLDLPGTIGIAHSRPAGDKNLPHPYISNDGRLAVVTNGNTPENQYSYLTDNVLSLLEENGYSFTTEMNGSKKGFPSLKNGNAVSPAEARVHYTDYCRKKLGLDMVDAMIKCSEDMYADNVYLTLSEDYPDSISVLRTTRPMNALLCADEVYLATTVAGFPEDISGDIMPLPLSHVCTASAKGIKISSKAMNAEKVCEITPYTYAEGYRGVTEFLGGKEKCPVFLDEIVDYIDDMPHIWREKHTYTQAVRLAYDIIEQLQFEGRLKSEIRQQSRGGLTRGLIYMWI